jgi:hypothetical protein
MMKKQLTHLSKFILSAARPFATDIKSGFPKHKELFTDEYFEGAEHERDDNPFSSNNMKYQDDFEQGGD